MGPEWDMPADSYTVMDVVEQIAKLAGCNCVPDCREFDMALHIKKPNKFLDYLNDLAAIPEQRNHVMDSASTSILARYGENWVTIDDIKDTIITVIALRDHWAKWLQPEDTELMLTMLQ